MIHGAIKGSQIIDYPSREFQQLQCTRVAEIFISKLRENILWIKSPLIEYCVESEKYQKGSFWA